MKRASLAVVGLGFTFAGSALAQESPPAPPKRNMMPPVPPVVLPPPKGASPGAVAPVVPPAPEPAPKAKPPVVPAAPPSPPVAAAPALPAPHVPPGHRPGPLPAPQAPANPPIVAAPPSPPVTACPPGAFCEPANVEPAAPPPTPAAPPPPVAEQAAPPPYTVPLPPPRPGSDPTRPRVIVVTPGQNGAPDDIVVYDDGAYPPPPPPPRPLTYGPHGRHLRPLRLIPPPMLGLNLRAEAALLSQQRDGYRDYGMGGIGASLRYRPVPAVALDAGIDIIGGTDTNGFARREVPLSVSTMLYVNPRSFAQFYFLGGLNLAFARVTSDAVEPNFANGSTDDYTYFGGHFGGGVEFRMLRTVAFNVDLLGTLRSRVDNDGDGRYPEYYDARTGLASNSSGGGLLRAGVTLWW